MYEGQDCDCMRQYMTARTLTQGTCSKEPYMTCPSAGIINWETRQQLYTHQGMAVHK
jgi:hypothetical protein